MKNLLFTILLSTSCSTIEVREVIYYSDSMVFPPGHLQKSKRPDDSFYNGPDEIEIGCSQIWTAFDNLHKFQKGLVKQITKIRDFYYTYKRKEDSYSVPVALYRQSSFLGFEFGDKEILNQSKYDEYLAFLKMRERTNSNASSPDGSEDPVKPGH